LNEKTWKRKKRSQSWQFPNGFEIAFTACEWSDSMSKEATIYLCDNFSAYLIAKTFICKVELKLHLQTLHISHNSLEILLFISIPDEPPPYKGNNIVQFETIEHRVIHLKIRISSMPHEISHFCKEKIIALIERRL